MTWSEIKNRIESLGVKPEDKIAWITIIDDPGGDRDFNEVENIMVTQNSDKEWMIETNE